jgi:LysM repeat protein
VKGDGNSYTTEFRQYDPRLGRWMSLDPLMMMFPDMSPYVAFDDNPVFFVDPSGLASQKGPGGPTVHSVNSGETLTSISKKYKVSIEDLVKWNNLKNPDKILAGSKLIVSKPEEICLVIDTGDNVPGRGPDMNCEGASMESIKEDLGLENSGPRATINRYSNYSDEELFNEVYGLADDFSDRPADQMTRNIVRHFQKNSGKPYSDWRLTAEAAKNHSTQNFVADISDAFQKAINQSGFKTDGTFPFSKYFDSKPHFNYKGPFGLGEGEGDDDNGLLFCVNDVWSYKIKVVNYTEVGNKYIATISIVLYDNFGLDALDITDHIYATLYPAFYAWYILQHNRGYNPFMTVMNLPYITITGNKKQ